MYCGIYIYILSHPFAEFFAIIGIDESELHQISVINNGLFYFYLIGSCVVDRTSFSGITDLYLTCPGTVARINTVWTVLSLYIHITAKSFNSS